MSTLPSCISASSLAYEITSLVAHIHAATARLLSLICEFDQRGQAADFGMRSTAHWLNWQCGISMGAAREKVRTALALDQLPAINAAFHKGELSYSKVRAITRVCTPDKEEQFLDIALCGSAAQVESIVKRYRAVELNLDAQHAFDQYEARCLDTYWDEEGCLVINGRLTAEQGALFLKAVHVAEDTPAEEATRRTAVRADALMRIAERYLSGMTGRDSLERKETIAANTADRYQVIINVPAETLFQNITTAELSAAGKAQASIEDGPAIAVETARRLCCDASIVPIIENKKGEILNIGRKTRAIPPAIRRALHKRDGGCRFPGCSIGVHYTDAHHVVHWANGGETSMDNLVLVCRHHHRVLHEGAYSVTCAANGRFVFLKPNREILPNHDDNLGGGNYLQLMQQNGALQLDNPLSHAPIRYPRESHPNYEHIIEVLFQ